MSSRFTSEVGRLAVGAVQQSGFKTLQGIAVFRQQASIPGIGQPIRKLGVLRRLKLLREPPYGTKEMIFWALVTPWISAHLKPRL